MVLISEAYRQQNALLHRGPYGSYGDKHAGEVRRLADELQTRDILDYGCGKGTLKRALGIAIAEYDPAMPEHEAAPSGADLVVCTDVLEHIEPACLDEVLAHLRTLTKRMAFIVISTRKAQKKLPDGRNAHLIVESPKWWQEKLSEVYELQTFEASGDEVRAICR